MKEVNAQLQEGARIVARLFYETMPDDIGNVFEQDDRSEQLAYFICWYEMMREDFRGE